MGFLLREGWGEDAPARWPVIIFGIWPKSTVESWGSAATAYPSRYAKLTSAAAREQSGSQDPRNQKSITSPGDRVTSIPTEALRLAFRRSGACRSTARQLLLPRRRDGAATGAGSARRPNGQDHVASHLVRLLLQISLHVGEEPDDRGPFLSLLLSLGMSGKRLGVDVVQIEDDQ